MASNQYILVSELPPGWTNEQRLALRGGVGQLGAQSTASPNAVGQPANVNHSRTSLDGTQILFQAMFEDGEITRANIVATIAEALALPEKTTSWRTLQTGSKRASCGSWSTIGANQIIT
ncbi:MAG: hypothetical protein ACYS7Y_36225 [Planctomycetota bacterium]|jgi:hypothetical protein